MSLTSHGRRSFAHFLPIKIAFLFNPTKNPLSSMRGRSSFRPFPLAPPTCPPGKREKRGWTFFLTSWVASCFTLRFRENYWSFLHDFPKELISDIFADRTVIPPIQWVEREPHPNKNRKAERLGSFEWQPPNFGDKMLGMSLTFHWLRQTPNSP